MGVDPQSLADLRIRLERVRNTDEERWRASRRLVEPAHVRQTLNRLSVALRKASLAEDVKAALLSAIRSGHADRIQDLSGERLKTLTGLPPTKAIRALSLLFGGMDAAHPVLPVSIWTPLQVEHLVRTHRNPFDLLLEADVASLLELGAGDLSFAEELVDHYLPHLRKTKKPLVLHCLDRLQPGSKLGGPLHARQDRLERLKHLDPIQFSFFGGQDMFALEPLEQTGEIASRYTVVTCWAPATPTFAYEPTRLSRAVIEADLRRTKGTFRMVEVDGEAALEVRHEGRTLLFPPWKFDIRGPLALLNLVARRGLLAVLGAVDTQVFWELLSQLVADPAVRPVEQILTPTLLADLFGPVYRRLEELPVGGSAVLNDVTNLRAFIPRVLEGTREHGSAFRFRYVEVRRGAVFPGIPASSTARLFHRMTQEAPPWFMILVPETVEDHRSAPAERDEPTAEERRDDRAIATEN